MGQRNGGGNESATQTKPHGNELIGNWKRKRKRKPKTEKRKTNWNLATNIMPMVAKCVQVVLRYQMSHSVCTPTCWQWNKIIKISTRQCPRLTTEK